MTDREEMIQMYSDFYKDAYGFRPRFDYSTLSDEHLQADFDHFEKKIEQNNINSELAENKAIIDFKKSLDNLMSFGASNEDEALRWLVGADSNFSVDSDFNEVYSDIEHFVWKQGFLFTDYGRQLVKRIECFVTQFMTV